MVWMFIALYIPRLLLQNVNIILRPNWKVEENLKRGAIVLMILYSTSAALNFIATVNGTVYFVLALIYCVMISLAQCFLSIILEQIVNIFPNRDNETGDPLYVFSSIPLSSMNLSYFATTIYVYLVAQIYLIELKTDNSEIAWAVFAIVNYILLLTTVSIFFTKERRKLINSEMFKFYMNQFV